MNRLRYLLGLCAVAVLLVGCGGGSSTASRTGRVRFMIEWPSRGRLIPLNTNWLRVTYPNGDGNPVEKVVPKGTAEVALNDVKADEVAGADITVRAYENNNDWTLPSNPTKNLILAEGTINVKLRPGDPQEDRVLTLDATVKRIAVTVVRSDGAAYTGSMTPSVRLTMTATAFDNTAGGKTVLVAPTTLVWSTSSKLRLNGSSSDATGTSVTVDAVEAGTASVTVNHRDGNPPQQVVPAKDTSVTVNISPPSGGVERSVAGGAGPDGTATPNDVVAFTMSPTAGYYLFNDQSLDDPTKLSKIDAYDTNADFSSRSVTDFASVFTDISAPPKGRLTHNTNRFVVMRTDGSEVRAVNNDGTTFSPGGTNWAYFPAGGFKAVDVDAFGGFTYVLETNGASYRIIKIDDDNVTARSINNVPAGLTSATSMAVESDGVYYITHSGSKVARLAAGVLNADFTKDKSNPPVSATDVAFDGGFVYVLDTTAKLMRILNRFTGDTILTVGIPAGGTRLSVRDGKAFLISRIQTTDTTALWTIVVR